MASMTIAGEPFDIQWTNASARLMRLRLADIGFDWTRDTKGERLSSAMVKIAWALLPYDDFVKFKTHEDMYISMTDKEDESLFAAVGDIFKAMSTPVEKKSTLKKSPLPESNSD